MPNGGNGFTPGYNPMDDRGGERVPERVAQLEANFGVIERDLALVKTSLRRIDDLPTRHDLWEWKLTWTGVAVGAVALIVGGIIGGLAWIKPENPRASTIPSPIVIQMPAYQGSITPLAPDVAAPTTPPPDSEAKPSGGKEGG